MPRVWAVYLIALVWSVGCVRGNEGGGFGGRQIHHCLVDERRVKIEEPRPLVGSKLYDGDCICLLVPLLPYPLCVSSCGLGLLARREIFAPTRNTNMVFSKRSSSELTAPNPCFGPYNSSPPRQVQQLSPCTTSPCYQIHLTSPPQTYLSVLPPLVSG